MVLFIESFSNKDIVKLESKTITVAIAWIIVFASIGIDLIVGVRKAKKINEARTSEGFRRTVIKITQYYCALTFALFFDILTSTVSNMPYATLLLAVLFVLTEAKSVFEKAEDKDRRKVLREFDTLLTLLKNKGDLANAFKELLEKQKAQENENNE